MMTTRMTKYVAAICVGCALILVSVQCGEQSGEKTPTRGEASDLYASTSQTLETGNTGEEITFDTRDGIRIEGDFYASGSSPAPAILCLHQWLSDRSAYADLARRLASSGFHVLAIDMRGHGGSTRSATGKKISPDRQAGPDIEAAIAYLKGRKEVDPNRLGIIGASYGASNALIYAAKNPDIKALVLLSPGINYFNVLPTAESIRLYGGRPVMSVASSEDMRSVEAVELYKERGGSKHEILMLRDAGHGTNMISAAPDLSQAIIGFYRKNL